MTVQARRAQGYALTKAYPTTLARRVQGYALIQAVTPLPEGKSGVDALKDLVVLASAGQVLLTDFDIDAVVADDTVAGRNTKVVIKALFPGNYSGKLELWYTRRQLQDMLVLAASSSISLSGETRTKDLLPKLNVLTKLLLTEADIVDEPIVQVGGKVQLTAAQNSAFFVPSTTVSLNLV